MNPLSLLSSRVPQYEPPRNPAADVGKPDEQARNGAPPGAVTGGPQKEAPRPGKAGPPPDGSPSPTPLRGAQTREPKPLGPEPDPAADIPDGIAANAISFIHGAPPVSVVSPPPQGGGGRTGTDGEIQPAPGPTPPTVAYTVIEEARVAVPASAPVTTSGKPKQAAEVPAPSLKGGAVGPMPRLGGPPTQIVSQPSLVSGQDLQFPGIVPQPSLGGVESLGIVPRPTIQIGAPVVTSGGAVNIGIVPKPSVGGETPKPVASGSEHIGIVPRPVSGLGGPRPVMQGQEAPMPGIVPRPSFGGEVPRPQSSGTPLTVDEALAKIVAVHVDEALGMPIVGSTSPTVTMPKPQPAAVVPSPSSQVNEAPQPGVMPRPASGAVQEPKPKPVLDKPVTDSATAKGLKQANDPVPVPTPVIAEAFDAVFKETVALDESGETNVIEVKGGDQPIVEGKPTVTSVHAPTKAQEVDRAQPLPEPEAKEVVRQLADRIENMVASRRSGQVVIKLEPYDLGTLTLTVKAFGNRVDADVTASNDSVRHSLTQHRTDLVQSVESRGLSLNSFNVGQEQAQGQTFAGYQDAHAEALRTAATARANSDQRPSPTSQPTFSANVLTAIDTVA